MAVRGHNPFAFPFKNIIIDEVALEGLEGISIDLLWRRIEQRISSPVTEKMQCRFWNIILKCNSITLYDNPVPVPLFDILDRFTIVDHESGDLKEPDDYLDGPYEYKPVENDYGSCANYSSRCLINKDDLAMLTYKDCLAKYRNTLVLVASNEERWSALAPHLPMSYLTQLSKMHYCILELVGRARGNGQVTVGKSNLTKIVKDSKILFYNRKVLQDLDLVRVSHITQVAANKGGTKAILLRLKRFHKSFIDSVPKIGWIHNLIQYLKEKANYCESTEIVMKKGLLSQKQNKRFQKKCYVFGFEENPIKISEMSTRKRLKLHSKRRYIYLSSISDDESADSEDEEHTPLKCQYKVGVNLMRQAYERFLEAGLKGLTQIELGQLLGIEFYMSRTICRMLKAKNIVREFLEDKGRQRMARFIAIAATAKIDNQFAKEKEKFMKYFDECTNLNNEVAQTNSIESDSENVVPTKKIKLENRVTDNSEQIDGIIEIKTIIAVPKTSTNLSMSETSKKLTLRQLKFASGALKVIRDHKYIVGYQKLSKLITEEIKEPPMDSKALKILLQKLVIDGCIKVIGIKWPGFIDKYTYVICAPYISTSDPEIRAHQKDIIKSSKRNIEYAKKRQSSSRPLTEYSFPRYVKVQKLHEALVKFAYLDAIKSEDNDLPPGFFYIKELIPELTLEVALGTVSSAGIFNISKLVVEDSLLNLKLRDVPMILSKALTNSSHLDNSIRAVLKVLAAFGLIQLVVQGDVPENNLTIHLYYVNQYASILDTSGIWPKPNFTAFDSIEKKYHFKTVEDVKHFWKTVYNVSISTTIQVADRRQKKPPQVPIRTQYEVEHYDKGLRFGNNLGPCGFDSSFYLDMQRLWKAYCARSNKVITSTHLTKTVIKIPRIDRTKRKIKKVKKKLVQKQKLAEKLPTINMSTLKQALFRQPLINRKKVTDLVTWTPEDDRVIMLCKAAITIMSPVSQPGCLQVRNLVAKDILTLRDPKKNQKACHRRAAVVDANSTITYEKNCIMAEIKQQHSDILKKYEGVLKKLRILHSSSMHKYLLVARIPMLELVWIMTQVLKECTAKRHIPNCVDLEEFHRTFTAVPSSIHQLGKSFKSSRDDTLFGPLKEAIMLTVMLSFHHNIAKEDAQALYYNFKRYDERTLRKAVEQLRHSGAMVAKEKVLNSLIHKVNMEDAVECWFKVSAQYQRKWLVRLNSSFPDDLVSRFCKARHREELKGCPDINCLCCELHTLGILDITPNTVPKISGSSCSILQEDQLNTIDIESRYKLKPGTLVWNVKKDLNDFEELYEDIKVDEPFEDILRYSMIKQSEYKQPDMNKLSKVEKKIIKHLKTKRERGSVFRELKDISGVDNESLIATITKLISQNIVRRVGVFDNFIILFEFLNSWSVKVNGHHILSKPWLTVDSGIRKDIFLKWAGVIVNRVFENPGCSFSYLSDQCEFLSTSAVQDVCDVVCKWECVKLYTMVQKDPDLFSDNDDETPDLVEYNKYESPENIVVFPVQDSLVKYSYIRKTILQSLDIQSCSE